MNFITAFVTAVGEVRYILIGALTVTLFDSNICGFLL
jgi:hypothetical protein